MRKTFYTIILFLASVVPIRSAYAESGPPPLQEVEATGQGGNADDAFKQAVSDAVRQVVGTLVSAENVIKNDRVIKDEVLTLSNGFVEKVLKRDRRKLPDGTWEVKLKCIVRKGQLYGTLQKANVPTIKFDGVSMFADVVSQLDHQKSSVEMIRNALKTFSSNLVTASMLEEKPAIVSRNEKHTDMKITWRAVVNVDAFFSSCAPALDAAFSGAALSKSKKPVFQRVKETQDAGILLGKWTDFGFGTDKKVVLGSIAAVPVINAKGKWGVVFYDLDPRISRELPDAPPVMVIVAHFCDASGRSILDVALTYLQFRKLENDRNPYGTIDHSYLPLICAAREHESLMSKRAQGGGEIAWDTNKQSKDWGPGLYDYVGSSVLVMQSLVRIPTDVLPRISKVELNVEGLDTAEL